MALLKLIIKSVDNLQNNQINIQVKSFQSLSHDYLSERFVLFNKSWKRKIAFIFTDVAFFSSSRLDTHLEYIIETLKMKYLLGIYQWVNSAKIRLLKLFVLWSNWLKLILNFILCSSKHVLTYTLNRVPNYRTKWLSLFPLLVPLLLEKRYYFSCISAFSMWHGTLNLFL